MKSQAETLDALFQKYSAAKGWVTRFHVSDDESDAFRTELRGINLRGSRILEIGFGPGAFLAWAQAQGAHVVGVEIDPASIAAARERGIALLPPAFEGAAAANEAAFDVIAGFDVFEHFSFEQIQARLAACTTMLKPGGVLILRFPNAQSPFGQAPQHGDATHITALSGPKIKQMTHDLDIDIVRYTNAARPPGRGLVKRAARLVRYLAQDVVEGALNALYPPRTPLGPVVTIILQKRRNH